MGSDWYMAVAGDDEREAERAELRRRRPVWSPPENEVPVALAVSATIGRADGLAIFLSGVQAYTTGAEFTVSMRRREAPRGHDLTDVFMGHHSGLVRPADRLLIGFEFADGTRVQSGGYDRMGGGPQLNDRGGGGGGRSHDKTMWLHPLPPAGPLTVVCTWLRLGVEETRTVLDGTAVGEAGARAQTLWPWEPEPDVEIEEPVEEDLALPGWFGETSG